MKRGNGGVMTRYQTKGLKCPSWTITTNLTVLMITLYIMANVQAYKTIRSGNECLECLRDTDKYRSVCRSKFSEQTSYCCSSDDINT